MLDGPQIGPGEHYALIGFRTNRPIGMDPVSLGAGLWAYGRLPFVLNDNWRELIGSVRERGIRDANLFLLARLLPSRAHRLHDENKKLEKRAWYLYQALLVSTSVKVFDWLFFLTGEAHPVVPGSSTYRGGGRNLNRGWVSSFSGALSCLSASRWQFSAAFWPSGTVDTPIA